MTIVDRDSKQAGTTPDSVRNLVVGEDEDGMRLDRWFKKRIPDLANSHLNKIVRTGQVRVDGRRTDCNFRLAAGQSVRVPPLRADRAESRSPTADPGDARALRDMILFEDDWLMVLNKPFGLAVQGGSGTTHHIDAMLESLISAKGERPRLVHRLDRDTSGALLVAKTRKMAAELGEIFRSRRTQKIYWAVVEGVPKPAQGRVSLFLAKGVGMESDRRPGRTEPHRDLEKMRIARHGDPDAQHSVTYYAIIDKVAPRLSWLSMKPITGRTHQLRAHAEAIGHPIVGDPKYSGHVAAHDPRRTDPMRLVPAEVDRKLHLCARRLRLPHPKGGELDVTAPLPPHMKATFGLFGFDEYAYDPIEEAPSEDDR